MEVIEILFCIMVISLTSGLKIEKGLMPLFLYLIYLYPRKKLADYSNI